MPRLLPLLKARFFDSNGDPLAGGFLYSYEAGTNIPLATYTDDTGMTQNSNPVELDANGEANVWIGTAQYKFILKNAAGAVQFTQDNVNGNLTTATDGVDGRTILYGTAAPSSGNGNDGDFYIRTTTNYLYGPKAAGAWPAGTSLVGPTGATGATGSAGSNGSNGVDGKTILNGTGAPGGGTGTNGDFYLDTASSVLYGPKAAGSWPSGVSLIGATGATGATGAAGANGAAIQESLTGTFSAGNTTYTLTQTPTAAAEVVAHLATAFQVQGTNYTISGKTITFAGEDTSALKLNVFYRY